MGKFALAALAMTFTLTACSEDPNIARLQNIALCNKHGEEFGLRVQTFQSNKDVIPRGQSQTDFFFEIAAVLSPNLPRKPFDVLLPFAMNEIDFNTSIQEAQAIGKRLCMVYFKER